MIIFDKYIDNIAQSSNKQFKFYILLTMHYYSAEWAGQGAGNLRNSDMSCSETVFEGLLKNVLGLIGGLQYGSETRYALCGRKR